MEKIALTCITCPIGCRLEVELEGGQVVSVTGNTCPRGIVYAKDECLHPMRMLTTTVRVQGGTSPLVAVRTRAPIPKSLLMDCMQVLNRLVLQSPIEQGQVVFPNILNTGIDVIATGCHRTAVPHPHSLADG